MTPDQIFQFVTVAALVLGGVWKLSAQISGLQSKVESLVALFAHHVEEDERRFGRLHDRVDSLSDEKSDRPGGGLRAAG